MKLFFFFLFFFLLDLYFYFGISPIISGLKGEGFYKVLYWISCVFIYLGIVYFAVNVHQERHFTVHIILSSLFFIFFISKLVGCFPLILDDILRFFRFISKLFQVNNETYGVERLEFLRKSALLVSGVLFSTLLIGIKWGRYNFKKNYQDIVINKWSKLLDNYKIIHISDLHLGSFNNVKELEIVVEMINEENPDLVVFTGDLVNNYYHEALPYVETLKKIKAKDGKYSVLGNHDYCDYVMLKRSSKEWKDNFNNLLKLQKEMGFELLLNEPRIIKKGNSHFNLVGVENWGAGNFNKDGDLDLAMNNVVDDVPTILLSHDPSHWTEQVLDSKYKIDLQLSGHTHGMQFGVELPGIKWSPAKYRYKYWAGLYRKKDKQIYVNRGLGHLGYAGRVGIMPDISILNIKSKS